MIFTAEKVFISISCFKKLERGEKQKPDTGEEDGLSRYQEVGEGSVCETGGLWKSRLRVLFATCPLQMIAMGREKSKCHSRQGMNPGNPEKGKSRDAGMVSQRKNLWLATSTKFLNFWKL